MFYAQDAVEAVFRETATGHGDAPRPERSLSTAEPPNVVELQVKRELGEGLVRRTTLPVQ